MKAVYLLFATIASILIGLVIYRPFFDLSLTMVNHENIQLSSNTISGLFSSNLIFAILSGFIPITYFTIQKVTKIRFIYHGIIVLSLLIGTGIVFWLLRVIFIKRKLELISSFDFQDEIKSTFLINGFKFENYLFLGFIVGALIVILIFRFNKKT